MLNRCIRPQAGFTLIEILVAASILGVLLMTVATLILANKATVVSDFKMDSARRLNLNVSELLRDAGFGRMLAECQRITALETDAPLQCTSEGVFLESPPGNPSALPLATRIDVFGTPNPAGEFCTEIRRCHLVAAGRILQVEYTTFFKHSNGVSTAQTPLLVRISR